jgi:hypothetical protein
MLTGRSRKQRHHLQTPTYEKETRKWCKRQLQTSVSAERRQQGPGRREQGREQGRLLNAVSCSCRRRCADCWCLDEVSACSSVLM